MFIRRHLWAICFSLCLIGFTVYLLLDTFAIKRVYTVVPQTGNSVSGAEESGSAESDDTDAVADVKDTDNVGDEEIDAADTGSTEDVKTDSEENTVIEESEVTAQELLDKDAWQVLSFGPGLVEDGEIAVSENEEVGKAMASNPRTALGVTEDGHYLFVVSDERTSESEGLSLYEMAEFMQSLGAATAYNLDGGGSSTMYFNGEVVNNPTTSGRSIKERSVSDIVYIGY